MKDDWLGTRFGLNFLAVGIVATLVGASVILIQDVAFLFTSEWPRLSLGREVIYVVLAAVASVFAIANVYIFRSGLPKYIAGILAISFGSYVVQSFVHPNAQVLRFISAARSIGICTLLLLVRTYFVESKPRNAHNR